MKNRIKEIRKLFPDHGKTQETFANYLGISKQNLASYETGRRTPSDAVIQLICEKCNVNKDWLLNGTGEMLIKEDIEFSDICYNIGVYDEKAKRAITNYWQLSADDKELFWEFLERIMPKKEAD